MPEYKLFQGDRFFWTDFLAAKTDDASLRVHMGKAILKGQGPCRTLIYTGAATCAPFGISLGPQNRPAVESRLGGFVAQDRSAVQARKFEIGKLP